MIARSANPQSGTVAHHQIIPVGSGTDIPPGQPISYNPSDDSADKVTSEGEVLSRTITQRIEYSAPKRGRIADADSSGDTDYDRGSAVGRNKGEIMPRSHDRGSAVSTEIERRETIHSQGWQPNRQIEPPVALFRFKPHSPPVCSLLIQQRPISQLLTSLFGCLVVDHHAVSSATNHSVWR